MSKVLVEQPLGGDVVRRTPDGAARVDVRRDGKTVWLTRRQLAEVFGTAAENVPMHLRNVLSSHELDEQATTKDSLVARSEGGGQLGRGSRHYDVDAIVSAGYLVNLKPGYALPPAGTSHVGRPWSRRERATADPARPARGTPGLDLPARTQGS